MFNYGKPSTPHKERPGAPQLQLFIDSSALRSDIDALLATYDAAARTGSRLLDRAPLADIVTGIGVAAFNGLMEPDTTGTYRPEHGTWRLQSPDSNKVFTLIPKGPGAPGARWPFWVKEQLTLHLMHEADWAIFIFNPAKKYQERET